MRAPALPCLALVALVACDAGSPASTGIPVVSLHITAPADSMYVADTLQLILEMRGPNGSALSDRAVTWTSSAPTLLHVNAAGLVEMLAAGVAWIHAESEGVRDSIRLKAQTRVTKVILSPDTTRLPQGFSAHLSTTLLDAGNGFLSGRRVTWATTTPAIVQVGESGVFARTPGTGNVIATAEGHADTALVIVSQRAVRVTVTPAVVTIALNDSLQLSAAAYDTFGVVMPGIPITFAGTFPTVGTVDAAGRLHSYGAGTATVTATSAVGITGLATVTVDGVDITSTQVGPGYLSGCGTGVTYDVCWGTSNTTGQVGNPAVPPFANPQSTPGLFSIALPARISAMGRISNHVCAIVAGGAAWCWGANGDKQLGAATGTCGNGGTCSATPLLVPGGIAFATISAGERHTCAVSTTGVGWCWGRNADGQLGVGNTTALTGPQAVAGGLAFLGIDGGTQFSCGIAADSTAWCWGANPFGQIGDASALNRLSPSAVSGGLHFAAISTGASHACAVTAAGAAWCWGNNNAGQLGSGLAPGTCANGVTCSNVPRPVSGALTFLQVGAGTDQTCGITTGHKLYCWGFYQGGGGNRLVPTPVAASLSFTTISLMAGNASAMGTDGFAYWWQIYTGDGVYPVSLQR